MEGMTSKYTPLNASLENIYQECANISPPNLSTSNNDIDVLKFGGEMYNYDVVHIYIVHDEAIIITKEELRETLKRNIYTLIHMMSWKLKCAW